MPDESARVFVSYARADGEPFAEELCQRLEREEPEITFWRDRDEMEGGKDWWNQITSTLDRIEFLVLVMTPMAMRSKACRAEWRYARSQGVCICPVMGAPKQDLDIGSLPQWMSRAHWYDLYKEWETFTLYLKSPCKADRVPFMAPELPAGYVERPGELSRLLDAVRDARQDPIAGTTVVHGAGGFGKTTLATAICHHDDVLTTFSNGILWVTLGETPDVRASLTKTYAALTGKRPMFIDEEDAANELARRLHGKNCLLVIDDVWDETHLKPFLRGGKDFACLVTTRSNEIALAADRSIRVDEMMTDEAVKVLTGHLTEAPADLEPFRQLAVRLGEWPILLNLASGTLRQRIRRGDTIAGSLSYLNQALDKEGFTAFDRRDAKERNQAIEKTLGVSLALLDDDERERYFELSTFPDDTNVPLATTGVLWGLDEIDTYRLADRLDDHSLLRLDLGSRSVQLHDVIRAYLEAQLEKSGHRLRSSFLTRAALADSTLRREQRRPDDVFELAREGKLKVAERKLALGEADPRWEQIALLTAAWLAADVDPEQACAVRDRVADEPVDLQVTRLLQRLRSLPHDAPLADIKLPEPPPPMIADEILTRLGGGGVTAIEPLNVEGLSDAGPTYLAEQDGPLLVAFAEADPEHNTDRLQRYISMLASNEYEFYRNQSLWALLEPVLLFQDASWVQQRLVDLSIAALTPRRLDFLEATAVTVAALLAQAGRPDAWAKLDDVKAKTQRERAIAGRPMPGRGLSAESEPGDPWSFNIRRLACLAEAYGTCLASDVEAAQLLDQAVAIPTGFAGFRAYAYLALAEANRICRRQDTNRIQAALDEALIAAHNIQDPTFCARTTARVLALRECWWSASIDVIAFARRLVDQPDAPEFCAVHHVGEQYQHRDRGPNKMRGPNEISPLSTLRELADVYRCPESELARANQEHNWGLNDVLPAGVTVKIPDPDFRPHIAARLAAEVLVALPVESQAQTLRNLLTVAQSDATALDRVAARLLIADPPSSLDAERVEAASAIHRAALDTV